MPSTSRHPFERIPPERRRVVLVTLLAFTFAVMGALSAIDASLRTHATPLGIVSFELCAWDASCGDALVAYRGVRLEAGMSLGLDYLFMPLYSAALAAALVFLAASRAPRPRSIAALLAWGLFFAAALDAVENAALYAMLATDRATPALAWAATGCASIKLALIAIGLLALPVLALGWPRLAPSRA